MGFISSIANSLSQLTGMEPVTSAFTAGLICGVIAVLLLKRQSTYNDSRAIQAREEIQIRNQGATASISVGGRAVDLNSAEMEAIQGCLARGNKIEAIKILRAKTGLGLKEAKEIVDALDAGTAGRKL